MLVCVGGWLSVCLHMWCVDRWVSMHVGGWLSVCLHAQCICVCVDEWVSVGGWVGECMCV